MHCVDKQKEGSAKNNIDILIDAYEFKFDSDEPDFVENIYSKLSKMDLTPEDFSEKHVGYREIVKAQKKNSNIEISTLLANVMHVISHSHNDEPIKQGSLSSY